MQIAVLGGGNGSFAAAGDLTMAGHEVRLWRRDAQAVAAHREAGCRILVKDFKGRHDVAGACVTGDMAEAVRGAELILCPAPATAQADIAKALAPHLVDGQVVFLPPATFGSLLFAKAARDAGNRRRRGLCGNRDAAMADAQAWPVRGCDHRARQAPAYRRVSAHAQGPRAGHHLESLPRRDRGLRRRALRRADECRARDPSAAHHHECRPAGAFRPLGHPQGGDASLDPPRHRRARCRAHRGAPGARLRRPAFSAWPITTRRRARSGCTAAARTTG